MQVWDENFPPQLEEDAKHIGKVLGARSPLFDSIADDSLVRCIYWIILFDYEAKRDAKSIMKAIPKDGLLPRDFTDHAEQLEAFATKVERHLERVPSFPIPPFWIPLMLRSYARELRQIAQFRTPAMRGRKDWRRKKVTEALNFFVQTMKKKTGKPHFPQIADFLNKASRLLGVDSQYDSDAIKMRIHRKARTVP